MRAPLLLLLWLALTGGVFAETNLTLTVDGVTYSNVTFGTATPLWVSVRHATGATTIPLAKLPPDLQERFGYDPQKATQWQTAQQKAAAEAATKRAEQKMLEKKCAEALWRIGTVDRILPDGIILVLHFGGHRERTSEYLPPSYVPPQDVYILLVGHPKKTEFAEGNTVGCNAYKEGVITIGSETIEKWVYCGLPPGMK